MNRTALLLGLSGGLLLAANAAQAGACSGEIMALQEQLNATPTMASGETALNPEAATQSVTAQPGTTNADPGANPLPAPDSAVANAGGTLGAAPSADAGGTIDTAHAAPSGSGEAASMPGSEQNPLPDANGGTLVQDGTTPPAETQPMDADAAQAGAPQTGAAKPDPDGAAQALARARALDQAGDEAGCMSAIDEARSKLGQ